MGDHTSDSKRTDDDVARLAYERFLTRGQEHGSDVADWLAAEQEMRLHAAVPAPAEAAENVAAEAESAAQATALDPATPRRRNRDRAAAPPAANAAAAPRVRM